MSRNATLHRPFPLLLAALACAVALSHAGPLRYLSIREGLSQSTVNAIAEDCYGFLWFGTQDGLNRFDGRSVLVFSRYGNGYRRDTVSLVDDHILRVRRTSDSLLWIGTYAGGLYRFSPSRGAMERLSFSPPDSLLNGRRPITSFCEDADGSLWIGTWGAGVLHVRTRPFTRIDHITIPPDNDQSLPTTDVADVLCDRTGTLWVGTWRGLYKRAPTDSVLHRVPLPGERGDGRGASVWRVHEDPEGTLWVGTMGSGLIEIDRKGRSRAHTHDPSNPASIGSNNISSIATDSSGVLWIGTNDAGLNRLDHREGSFRRVGLLTDNVGEPSSRGVLDLLVDGSGILWIGTSDGVVSHDPKRSRFEVFRRQPGSASGLSHDVVRAIQVDREGGLWVGTLGGVDYAPPGSTSFRHFRAGEGNRRWLAGDEVLSLCCTAGGDVWAGTQSSGLSRFTPTTGRYAHYRHNDEDSTSLPSDAVLCLLEDRKGRLWVGTLGGGVARFDGRTGRFHRYRRRTGVPGQVSGNYIYALHEDREGSLWVGTWGRGLCRLDETTGRFETFLHAPDDPTSLPHNTVMCITQASDGALWVGTDGGGCARRDPVTGAFRSYSQPEGLPNDVVYGIVEDRRGRLWLSTNRGVASLDQSTGTVRTYGPSDGLQGDEFNHGAYCSAPDGSVLFGGMKGLNRLYPDSLRTNPRIPRVVLTSIKILDREVLAPAVDCAPPPLILDPDQNMVSFEFAALDFTAPERNHYSYRLEGIDAEWRKTAEGRSPVYMLIPAGEYTFRVRGSNNDGLWNETGAMVSIRVSPHFWMTRWFRIAVMLALLGVVLTVYRLHISRLVALEKMRVRIASDLHDDIGSTLTKIAVQSEVIQATSDPARIPVLARQIGSASREAIGSMSDIVWSIDARHDRLGNLVDRMRDFVSETLGPRNVEVEFVRQGLDASRRIPADVRQTFYLVFKEAVNNIARHSDARRIVIALTLLDRTLRLDVRDDGNVSDAPHHLEGQGLRNMKMRADRIGATLTIEGSSSGMRILLEKRGL